MGMVAACRYANPDLAESIWRSMGKDDRRWPHTVAYVMLDAPRVLHLQDYLGYPG